MAGEATRSQAAAAASNARTSSNGVPSSESAPSSNGASSSKSNGPPAVATASSDRSTPTGPAAGGAGSVRASDADRHALVDLLSKATGEGRITLEEFADAAGAAYATVTRAELDDLYYSLGLAEPLPPPPDAPAPPSPSPSPSTTAATTTSPAGAPASTAPETFARSAPAGASQIGTADRADNVVAIMSGAQRKGRWTVRRRTRAFAFWGGVQIDLRNAVIESDVVEITAVAIMGGVNITVPEGIPVEMSGCVIMGSRNARIADVPPLPGAPVVRVKAGGLWGGVDVRSRPGRKRSSQGGDPAAAAVAAASSIAAAAMAGAAAVGGALVDDDLTPRGNRSLHDHDHLRHRSPERTRDRDRDRPRDQRGDGPPPGPPPQSGDLLTVVCTDIVGSTRMAVALGDQRWHSVLSEHNAVVRGLLGRFGGTEVKTSGDGFLLTFTSARAAFQFSMALQDAAADERATDPDAPIELRIGVHAGEVERDGTDVIGRNVTIACRLCDAAAPGEVLASSVVADLADSASDLAFGPSREHALPGIDRPLVARPATRA